MIVTNKFDAILNMEKINIDFDIYRVSKPSGKLENTNVLDLSKEKYKALAVQYQYGKNAFVLFKKNSIKEWR